jgi:hypothetical protein
VGTFFLTSLFLQLYLSQAYPFSYHETNEKKPLEPQDTLQSKAIRSGWRISTYVLESSFTTAMSQITLLFVYGFLQG